MRKLIREIKERGIKSDKKMENLEFIVTYHMNIFWKVLNWQFFFASFPDVLGVGY